ncbi:MAG TPA: hypothetical protein VNE18_14050 [Rhodanobacter sp.]|nr:hypothetical protein [Rhodanobacter sp.]
MASMMRAGSSPTRRFAAWAIVPWILLLLAALGCLQYLQHAQYAYLLAAMVVIVVSVGCILRQAWARPTMRVLATLLALWVLVTGVLMLKQWGDFETARQHAMAQPQLGQVALWLIARARRTWQVGLALKAAAIPLLLWLAWVLGTPAARAQFRRRR